MPETPNIGTPTEEMLVRIMTPDPKADIKQRQIGLALIVALQKLPADAQVGALAFIFSARPYIGFANAKPMPAAEYPEHDADVNLIMQAAALRAAALALELKELRSRRNPGLLYLAQQIWDFLASLNGHNTQAYALGVFLYDESGEFLWQAEKPIDMARQRRTEISDDEFCAILWRNREAFRLVDTFIADSKADLRVSDYGAAVLCALAMVPKADQPVVLGHLIKRDTAPKYEIASGALDGLPQILDTLLTALRSGVEPEELQRRLNAGECPIHGADCPGKEGKGTTTIH